ncbi:MAG: acyltransferase family protein [Pseudomonas sp.]|uniref:acyltransferase family protein n=1 Tax=Pseudomonas sp. TaxID=306 RepID=UPI003D0EDA5D
MTSLVEKPAALEVPQSSHTKYRPDIDGLRALAVLPVILFHAGLSIFSGGYVGVDVFFVISGYLITSIIVAEKKSGKFKLSSFYSRRAKRILPVLLVVMAATSIVAWFFLPPKEMDYFSQSILSTILFGSNILFWLQSGYFDTAAELKPLLHTWSLAVEEQYYIFFPLLIMLLWSAGRKVIVPTMALLLVASAAFSVWFVSLDPVGAFYLLPARAWEILIGAMVALLNFRATNRNFGNIASLVGLALIVIPMFLYGSTTALSELYALPAVFGAALIIQFSMPGTIVYRLLTLRPMLWVGLLSYSAYLWHQPILAFSKIKFSHDLDLSIVVVMVALTFVLSMVTFRFIENPARRAKGQKSYYVMGGAVAGVLVLGCVGYLGSSTEGFPSRADKFYSLEAQNDEANLWYKYTVDSQSSDVYKSASSPKDTILVIGDSYEFNWSVGINENIDHSKYRVVSATYLECDVAFNGGRVGVVPKEVKYRKGCENLERVANDDELLKSISKILFVSFRPFEYGSNMFRFDLLRHLQERSGARLYLFGNYYQFDKIESGTCMGEMFSTFRGPGACLEKTSYPSSKLKDYESTSVGVYPKYTLVDIIDLVCGYEKDKCPSSSEGVPFMLDWNHLNAKFVKSIISDISKSKRESLEELGLSDLFR